jgi:hypothetical protein
MVSEKCDRVSKEFYELCYRQYEFELKETDQIYQRVSFVLVLISLLGTIIFRLGRIDILGQIISRVDVCLYYLAILIALVFLALSVLFGILFALPRKKKYKTLASMNLWQKWRDDYIAYLDKSDDPNDNLDELLYQEITKKLAEAQAVNSPINEKRRLYFHRCVLMTVSGIIPVSIQAIMYLVLKLKGVS